MTIAFKELAGSPVETYGPEGLQARRILLCPWDDREQVVEQLLGDGYEYGGRSRAQYPGKPDILAVRARCEPFADDVTEQTLDELTEGLNRYHGFAKVTVDYELLVSSDRDDLPSIESGTFLTYRQRFDEDSIQLPSHGLSWLSGATVAVPPEAAPTVRIVIVEHKFTWHRVVRPPWQAIRQCVGTLNDAAFLGATSSTVRFDGATADREFIRIDDFASPEIGWRIGYVFRERAVKTGSGQIVGWNHAYRSLPADTPGWDELTDGAGDSPYPSSDFTSLFRFSTTSA